MNNEKLFSLEDKVAIVTGGNGHLGRGIVHALNNAGAKVIVGDLSNNDFDEKFINKQNVFFENIDISSTTAVKNGFKNIDEKYGKIDILINNAVYGRTNTPDKMTDEEWETGINGTLSSLFRCSREIIPFFIKNKEGCIINIASMYGVIAPDFKIYNEYNELLSPPNYGASKAGVIQLTKYFASYFAKENIRVNCISPGAFPSEAVQHHKGFIEELRNKIPMGRIGSPDDLSGAIVFLASDSSRYITGQNLIIDGGWTIL